MSNDNQLDIQPIASAEAERLVIGAMLHDATKIDDVFDLIKPQDFFYQRNRTVMETIERLHTNDEPVDLFTVAEPLSSSESDTNWVAYLGDIMAEMPSTANLRAYSGIVKEKSTKRHVLTMANTVAEYITTQTQASMSEVIEVAQVAMLELEQSQPDDFKSSTVPQAVKSFVKELERREQSKTTLTGLSTGSVDEDEITGGYRKGELGIVAARPSMGKTTKVLQMASTWAIQGKRGVFFSLEMTEEQLTEKMIACHGEIELKALKSPAKYNGESLWSKVNTAANKINHADMHIVNSPGIHINQLCSYARKMARRKKLDFVVVDHIHIMGVNDKNSYEREIAKITAGLKTLAGQLECPVVALAQLNRGLEQRQNKIPVMSDLRSSGSIEQDADLIQFIYCDDYYNDDPQNPNKDLMLSRTAKNRNGAKGDAFYEKQYSQSRSTPSTRTLQFAKKTSYADDL